MEVVRAPASPPEKGENVKRSKERAEQARKGPFDVGDGPNTVSESTVSSAELSEVFWRSLIGDRQRGSAMEGVGEN